MTKNKFMAKVMFFWMIVVGCLLVCGGVSAEEYVDDCFIESEVFLEIDNLKNEVYNLKQQIDEQQRYSIYGICAMLGVLVAVFFGAHKLGSDRGKVDAKLEFTEKERKTNGEIYRLQTENVELQKKNLELTAYQMNIVESKFDRKKDGYGEGIITRNAERVVEGENREKINKKNEENGSLVRILDEEANKIRGFYCDFIEYVECNKSGGIDIIKDMKQNENWYKFYKELKEKREAGII